VLAFNEFVSELMARRIEGMEIFNRPIVQKFTPSLGGMMNG
jgi:hypothetical protein